MIRLFDFAKNQREFMIVLIVFLASTAEKAPIERTASAIESALKVFRGLPE